MTCYRFACKSANSCIQPHNCDKPSQKWKTLDIDLAAALTAHHVTSLTSLLLSPWDAFERLSK